MGNQQAVNYHPEGHMEPCDHVGFHSGRGSYDQLTGQIRYVLVCDACETEVRELERLEYRPAFTLPELPEAA
jgi:hypothetical protein